MKRLLLTIAITALLASCGKSEGEQMLYDYQKDNVKSGLNMDLEDLAFEIKEVKEVDKITAADSVNFYRNKLAELWLGEGYDTKEADTLTYEYVITELDSLEKGYQKLILLNIELGQEYKNYALKDKRDQASDWHLNALTWKMYNDTYQKRPDSILSTKYQAQYSINNPMLNNNKQTFDKYFYTNSENSKIIEEKMIDEENSES